MSIPTNSTRTTPIHKVKEIGLLLLALSLAASVCLLSRAAMALSIYDIDVVERARSSALTLNLASS